MRVKQPSDAPATMQSEAMRRSGAITTPAL